MGGGGATETICPYYKRVHNDLVLLWVGGGGTQEAEENSTLPPPQKKTPLGGPAEKYQTESFLYTPETEPVGQRTNVQVRGTRSDICLCRLSKQS